MTYFYIEQETAFGQVSRHILRHLPDGGVQSFPDVDSNSGPERAAYLQWQLAGNVPQPWEG